MSAVPVIDIADLFEGGTPRLRVARAIGAACEGIGFFCITGHGIDSKLTDSVRRVARDFFRLPLERKSLIARQPPRFRGYVGMGTEGLGRISGYGVADLKEAFSMGPVDFPAEPYFTNPDAAAHFETNRWPDHPEDFRAVMEDYYRVMTALAARLMGGFALALDLPERWFADKIDRPISNVRVNYYPAQAQAPEEGMIRAGAHTDYGSVTILLTEESSAGLEVRSLANEWIAIPHRPGHFVVNIGDLMAQWTNDRFVSTMHRVGNPRAGDLTDRVSVAFFQQPNYDALIDCIPTCRRAGETARYKPITSGDHRRLKLNFASTGAAA